MAYTECRSFRKEQIKRRKRLQNRRKPKPDPLLKHLADLDGRWGTLKGHHEHQ